MFEIITYFLFGNSQKDIVGTWGTGKGEEIRISCEGEKFIGSRIEAPSANRTAANEIILELQNANIKNMWEGSYIDPSGSEYFCMMHWVKGSLVANLESKDGFASKTKYWKRIK